MNIITALNDEKMNKELNKIKQINVLAKDIQYREGILEILEQNKDIEYILINENIDGQIKIEKLIEKINKKIKILMILQKKDTKKEKYLLENKIQYIYLEEMSIKKIMEKIFNKNKIIAITGNAGSGKTITTFLLGQFLSNDKKILIVEDNIKNNSILNMCQNEKKQEFIQIKNNLFVWNIKEFCIYNKKNKNKIIKKIKEVKKNFNYILIDMQNFFSLKIYEEIIQETILICNPNLMELNKLSIFFNKNVKIIINHENENSISEKIIRNVLKNKPEILGKIKETKNYNLVINNHMNINYLDKETKSQYLKIIEKI